MVIASAFCLFAALPAAQASGIQAGFIAGQASGNQGSTYNNTTSIYGAGNATGSQGHSVLAMWLDLSTPA